jgi:Cellulase (glycosyl hydrolase family 5)
VHKQHWHVWLAAWVIPMSIFFALLFVLPGRANDRQGPVPSSADMIQPLALSGGTTPSDGSDVTVWPEPKPAATNLLTSTLNLPIVLRNYPWPSPFGVELNAPLGGTLLARAESLGPKWIRFHRVSWRAVQPDETSPYDWSVLSSFEDELRSAREAGFTPIVIIHHSPPWATINIPSQTDCGAIRTDKLDEFAAFVQALVNRYKGSEFNVHYWELGNEPDIDPTLVPVNQVFGCWGDISDPYYGGRHYGEMLKVVTPAIKAADPSAKVLIGGLLLATPDTTTPGLGKPELFLKGILTAGAAPYFDIVPYHAYPSYTGANVDYDNGLSSGKWYSWGGWTVGKARFLRQMMADFGVVKPLFLDETALGCNSDWYPCDPVPADFLEAQADYIVRTLGRALSEDIQAIVWYTLNGPGWRQGGLLDASSNPRPSYVAYQNLIARLYKSRFEQAVNYGPAIEGYSFATGAVDVQVVCSIDTTPDTILVPQSTFLAAYDRGGTSLTPTPVGSDYQFNVGFGPIFLELRR